MAELLGSSVSIFLASHYRLLIEGSEKLDDTEIRLPC